MPNPTLSLLLLAVSLLPSAAPKSTIEPCSNSDTCSAALGYTLYTDLKVSEVASLFQIDPISLLSFNSISLASPDSLSHILPSQLFLSIPIACSCVDGIRKSTTTRYKTRPADTLTHIAESVYGGLVSSDQLKEANNVPDPDVLDVGQTLTVPLPCTCFNGTDSGLPAVYLSYVVRGVDTLAGIGRRYGATVADLMDVNALGGNDVSEGDILAVPLSACASSFPTYASDYGLSVPNGSYAITASHCVQCSCGPSSRNLYCMPASLSVSCSSMQCQNSNLMLGNVTWQQSAAGCKVTSCSYGGFVNGSIVTTLSTSLQPLCPGPQQFPALVDPPTTLPHDTFFSPAPAPSVAGGIPGTTPTVPSTGSNFGISPTNAPSGGLSSSAPSLYPLSFIVIAMVLGLFLDPTNSL